MQATVGRYDAATRSGTVLLDDGIELPFGPPAVRASGLRLLRPGQRLHIRLDETGTVVVLLSLTAR